MNREKLQRSIKGRESALNIASVQHHSSVRSTSLAASEFKNKYDFMGAVIVDAESPAADSDTAIYDSKLGKHCRIFQRPFHELLHHFVQRGYDV